MHLERMFKIQYAALSRVDELFFYLISYKKETTFGSKKTHAQRERQLA
jgi:hypothetical protein